MAVLLNVVSGIARKDYTSLNDDALENLYHDKDIRIIESSFSFGDETNYIYYCSEVPENGLISVEIDLDQETMLKFGIDYVADPFYRRVYFTCVSKPVDENGDPLTISIRIRIIGYSS